MGKRDMIKKTGVRAGPYALSSTISRRAVGVAEVRVFLLKVEYRLKLLGV